MSASRSIATTGKQARRDSSEADASDSCEQTRCSIVTSLKASESHQRGPQRTLLDVLRSASIMRSIAILISRREESARHCEAHEIREGVLLLAKAALAQSEVDKVKVSYTASPF